MSQWSARQGWQQEPDLILTFLACKWKEVFGMLILKRLAVWLVETSSEVVLLGLVLTVLLGHDRHAFFTDLAIYSSGIILLFVTTDYVLSTIVVRAVWSGRTLWSYPAIATVLFFIHFETMNVGLGGAFEPSARVRIRAAGACIVLVCTLTGTLALRKWAPAGSKLAETQP
jgi:hypothetical protein